MPTLLADHLIQLNASRSRSLAWQAQWRSQTGSPTRPRISKTRRSAPSWRPETGKPREIVPVLDAEGFRALGNRCAVVDGATELVPGRVNHVPIGCGIMRSTMPLKILVEHGLWRNGSA